MSKQFWMFMLVGVGVIGAGIYFLLLGTRSAHLELTGSILKVRVLPLDGASSIVVADFRITNPSVTPFVVETVRMDLEPTSGDKTSGRIIARQQMDMVFQGLKLIGPKYNEILSMQDKIPPGQTVDRMAAARFELPSSKIDARKMMTLTIDEVDGATAEIAERK